MCVWEPLYVLVNMNEYMRMYVYKDYCTYSFDSYSLRHSVQEYCSLLRALL